MKTSELEKYFKKKRKDFPILKKKIHGYPLVYFDNGATSQKPKIMIETLKNYYEKENANVHRGIHSLSESATSQFEEVRKKTASFFNTEERGIVFTSGTTDSLNILAYALEHEITKGDEIILGSFEHHANLVPWQELAKRKKAKLVHLKLDSNYELNEKDLERKINQKTKLITLPHISNVTGTILPIEKIGKIAKKKGIFFLVDAAQSVPHMKIDYKTLNCDAFVFSSHKMYGPTGLGAIVSSESFLKKLKAVRFGGSMIDRVELETSTYNEVPFCFEAGTPNIADVIAFGSTLDYLQKLDMEKVEKYERELVDYFLDEVKTMKKMRVIGPLNPEKRSAVFSLVFEELHANDLAMLLDKKGFALRSGHHCAMPLAKERDANASLRASLSFYNTKEEIQSLFKTLREFQKRFAKS